MNKIKISAVSYTNSIPFVEGIKQSDEVLSQIDLCLDIPLDCARKLIEGKVDIGLIPVAAIPFVANAQIISDYCIGSDGAVNSVFILSDVPIQDVKVIKLDPQSRTSNNLSKILLKNHWQLSPRFISDESADYDAQVLIGDRTFGVTENFKYVYDLGAVWKDFTGLPFVFAAWVSSRPLESSFLDAFNKALGQGLELRPEIIERLPKIDRFDLKDYLMHKLDFNLNADKRKAIDLFLNYLKQLD